MGCGETSIKPAVVTGNMATVVAATLAAFAGTFLRRAAGERGDHHISTACCFGDAFRGGSGVGDRGFVAYVGA